MRMQLFGWIICFWFSIGYSTELKPYSSLYDAVVNDWNNNFILLFENRNDYKESYNILFDMYDYIKEKPNTSPTLNELKKKIEKEIITYDLSILDKNDYNNYLRRLALYYYKKKDDTNALAALKGIKVFRPITSYDDFHGGIGIKRSTVYLIRHDILEKGDIFRYYRYLLSSLDVLQYSEILYYIFLMPFKAIGHYPGYVSYWIWGILSLAVYGTIIFLIYKVTKKLLNYISNKIRMTS